MIQTPARTQFKRHLGQANHYLVTSLLALEELDGGTITQAPPELHAAWNPRDKGASVARTRIFVLQSFLGWAVDSVDMYLSLLNRKPKFIRDTVLISQMDGAGRSVSRKVRVIAEHYNVHAATLALVDVLITWRNNVFHELADNLLRPGSAESLVEHLAYISEHYRGLDASGLAVKAENGEALTFKETASLIQASHTFVQEVDGAVLSSLDVGAFCVEAVLDALGDRTDKAFSAKYHSLTGEARERFTKNWLQNVHGMVGLSDTDLGRCMSLRRSTR